MSYYYNDSVFFVSSMKCGTPTTVVRNVNVRKTMAWGRLTVMTMMSAMEMLSVFKMRRAITTASPQVL